MKYCFIHLRLIGIWIIQWCIWSWKSSCIYIFHVFSCTLYRNISKFQSVTCLRYLPCTLAEATVTHVMYLRMFLLCITKYLQFLACMLYGFYVTVNVHICTKLSIVIMYAFFVFSGALNISVSYLYTYPAIMISSLR